MVRSADSATPDSANTWLVGEGLLYDAIAAAVGPSGDAAQPPTVVVSAWDGWRPVPESALRAYARGSRAPVLQVHTELSHVVIGPLEEPGRPGCVDCAALRRRRVQDDRAEREAVRARHAEQLATAPAPGLTPLAARVTAAVVAEEIASLVHGAAPRTRSALLRLNLDDLTLTRHTFLPEPDCETCGGLPDDSAAGAAVTLLPRPMWRPGSYRVADVSARWQWLVDTYVDQHTGLIHSLNGWSDGGLVMTSAPLAFRGGLGNAGFGRAVSLQASRQVALLESLERYSSSPGARRTAVIASYQELASQALDPHQLGLYPSERYELPDFAFEPFAADQPYRWVWGWSLRDDRAVLVPEACAYYGVPAATRPGPRFVYECSNGCALGSCVEEAALYGLLEVAERDAFLLTWYAQLPAPRIELESLRGHRSRLVAEAIRVETGYDVLLFDITTEQRIPCVWAVARNPSGDGRPALASAAGSHPDPYRAVENALAELGPNLASLSRQWAQDGAPERARRMVEEADLVRAMDDHALLHAHPDGARRLDFLLGSPPTRNVRDLGGPEPGGFASNDLRDCLNEAVGRYAAHGLDVIVVDQSTPEQAIGGFRCVKVIIPGTIPMTFGHRYRRVDGLPRLYHAPRLLGYRDSPLLPSELSVDPHPFP